MTTKTEARIIPLIPTEPYQAPMTVAAAEAVLTPEEQ